VQFIDSPIQKINKIGKFSEMSLTKQQFENLDLWKTSTELATEFCCIAEKLEKLHLEKLSEHMQEICTCLQNNIAEISENHSNKSVMRLLTNAHFLTLESENFVMLLFEQELLDSKKRTLFCKNWMVWKKRF